MMELKTVLAIRVQRFRLTWWDLLSSLFLATLSLLLSISMKLKRYDKHT